MLFDMANDYSTWKMMISKIVKSKRLKAGKDLHRKTSAVKRIKLKDLDKHSVHFW